MSKLFKQKLTLIFIYVISLSFVQSFQNNSAVAGNGGVCLTSYTEKHQGAFHMLIPKGWKDEGGMIPSGVNWNIVDLIEHNISFRVTSPDGKSFFGWYPRFYFQDPQVFVQSSMGILRPNPGEVLNGCWVYPYMGIADYIRNIVFNRFAVNEFQNPRILGRAVVSSELKPFAPQQATRSDYGYVNIECTINGTPTLGRIYTINYDLGGMIWSTVGTFGWMAPRSRCKEDERIMEICIRSFRIDPAWAKRAAAAANQRARRYHEVIREINRIDNEINQGHSQTNSDIQEEVYKVLTDQIETYDPETNSTRYLPMYNHAYTDGRGNYFLRDYDDGTLPFDNASEWHKLAIVNRNAPKP